MFAKDISYEFTEVELTEKEFKNLVFMGPPSIWEKYKDHDEDCKFLFNLCYKPLEYVAKKVVERARETGFTSNPTEVFKHLTDQDIKARKEDGSFEDHPWFRPHMLLCKGFEKEVMGELWIRNLTNYDGGERHTLCPKGSFYVEDGNHRALVYAVILECSQGQEKYKPVKALHATSWDIADGILGHPCQPAKALEHDGNFPADGGVNIEKRNKPYKSGFHAAIRRYGSFVT